MLGTTIGDELRMASQFKSKVISISLKDRASVVSGGHTANAAYWFDLDAGTFISSTYYMPSLPEWVARFNAEGPTKAYCGNPWRALEASGSLGGQVWSEFRAEPGQPCPNRKFVHWLHETPFTNEVELNFAKEAVKNEALGKGPETDLLAVSLSSNDSIGHAYGPDSPQVADATLRTDRYLADFFSFLDQTVGLRNVWIALSADHGVAPTPAFVMEHHLGQGAADMGVVAKAMSHALSQAFGTDQWIEGQAGFQIYLNPVALRTHHVAQDHAELVAAQAAALVPGVQAAFTRHQLLFRPTLDSSLARKVGNSFFGPRSGDVYIVLEQFAVTVHEKSTTTHGSPWSYDAHVPLILWGDAFLPGDYSRPVEPVDLAPTLSAALGLDQPSGSEGKPLTIALKP
jgi:predicted AlkP superfamily pyrophosphatase or phosphodiesterase